MVWPVFVCFLLSHALFPACTLACLSLAMVHYTFVWNMMMYICFISVYSDKLSTSLVDLLRRLKLFVSRWVLPDAVLWCNHRVLQTHAATDWLSIAGVCKWPHCNQRLFEYCLENTDPFKPPCEETQINTLIESWLGLLWQMKTKVQICVCRCSLC